MLRLRLEVQPDAKLNEVCTQATRIATQLGIEVVFDYLGNEAVAKPGMHPDSLLNEFINDAKAPEAKATDTKETKAPKETGKKGKGVERNEEFVPGSVQKESI